MNTPLYHLSENNQMNNISDHDNFFLNNKEGNREKIYPELVEVTEHIVLGLEHNPDFKNKIINCEYDMLIGDDVSGRPVTLMLKHIIDHFRKEKDLKGSIDNIFIDNVHSLSIFDKKIGSGLGQGNEYI